MGIIECDRDKRKLGVICVTLVLFATFWQMAKYYQTQ